MALVFPRKKLGNKSCLLVSLSAARVGEKQRGSSLGGRSERK